jgi:hypothetical protein
VFAPDPWPVDWSQCPSETTASSAATDSAVAAASQVLDALSGRQYGLTTVTFRPCKRSCLPAGGLPAGWTDWVGGWPTVGLVAGVFVNLTCYSCSGSCSCAPLEELYLTPTIRRVVEVKVNGAPLASGTAYRLDAGHWLLRTDGGSWPICQDLNLPDTQPGTWSVTVQAGQDVPTLGQLAVGELACEFLRGFRGEDCQIPRSVVSLARQGVNIEFPNAADLLTNGKLGLRTSDLFLAAVNPNHLTSRGRVLSPDTLASRPRRVG